MSEMSKGLEYEYCAYCGECSWEAAICENCGMPSLHVQIAELEAAIRFTLKSYENGGEIGYSSIERLRAALKEQEDE